MATLAGPPALDNTLGVSLVGLTLSCTIFGITIMQTYSYYLEYPEDRRFLKFFVAFIMMLDLVTMTIICHSGYWYTVTWFGNYDVLEIPVWSSIVQIPLGSMLAACVQAFFAFRIFVISAKRNYLVPVIIIILLITEVVGGIGFGLTAFLKHLPFNDTGPGVLWTVLNNGAGLICDTLITGSMIFYLRKGRSQFKHTQSAINALMLYSLNTGILTSVFSLLALVTFVTVGKFQTIYVPFLLVLGRIYTCSFMCTLNTRKALRAQASTVDTVQLSDLLTMARTPNDGVRDVEATGLIYICR